jgi:hypothetical protein
MRTSRFGLRAAGFTLGLLVVLTAAKAMSQANSRGPELTVSGTRFLLDGTPFPYTGVSFFNALYNRTFNESSETRLRWLAKFQSYGVNVLRVWCQWDNARGFVDAGPERTLYHPDGQLRAEHVKTLKAILTDASQAGVVIELVLFSQESYGEGKRLAPDAATRAVEVLTRELQPWRNLVFQIWNEHDDDQVLPLVRTIKTLDPKRLVTSSPGFAGALGPKELNEALDFLTPHTSRQGRGKTWERAPKEIAQLLKAFQKPVVDDEPARNGTPSFGGPKDRTFPTDHILHVWEVWKVGGYVTYHHDMFQTGAGSPAVPPSGIPDPEFNPYHRQVFEFLRLRSRYDVSGASTERR